jgi:hypothetical protein
MENNKFFVLGMLALGLVLAGCPTDGGDESYTGPKTIKITGFNQEGYTKLVVFVFETPQFSWPPVVECWAAINGTDITVDLYVADDPWEVFEGNASGEPWAGSGKYYLWIQLDDDSGRPPPRRPVYLYAVDGTTPVSEEAEADYDPEGIAPIYIKEAVTTLEWSKFVYRGVDPQAG